MKDNKELPKKSVNKDSIIGKGYSYLIAILLTILFSGLHVDYKVECNSVCSFSIQRKDVSVPVTLFFLVSISTLIGMPTDSIAITIGKILSGKE